uniref:iron-sulfur cluster co-chaperone protein HscB isoform X2 n=1 Tax=Gasterosteus aculeatus aculeatus TaxID=481459 RepID=UPI001A99AC90|nr:iron-sulfur cluster co-chaperone protein HscB isoform X2 [Gasterosteus aculeatus aculeatus]
MLSLKTLRILCSSGALLHHGRLATRRQTAYTTVTCRTRCMSSIPVKDTRHSCLKLEARGRERKLIDSTTPASSHRSFCTGQVQVRCWKCEQPLDANPAFFCTSCNVIQPPEEDASYFKTMDCDFTFSVDTQKLQRRYLQLQRALHPDNFSQKSVTEQEYSESHSALVNKAYQTLLKPLSRGLYMLELEGIRTEEGTDPGADPRFLAELMEINEALDGALTPEDAEEIGRHTKGKLAVLTEAIDAALLEGELQAAKALLAQMKYFANIEEKVKEKLSEFM